MEIISIEAIALRDPEDVGAEETVLVVVEASDGTRGYGEAVSQAPAVCAVLESANVDPVGWDAGVQSLLIGRDPRDPAGLWSLMKNETFWSCRAGIGHVALAGVDMALWDLAGKLTGRPAWQLMGERRNEKLIPYVTAYHGPATFEETLQTSLDALDMAIERGFTAAKVEALPNTAPGLGDFVTLAQKARERVGDDFTLLLDVGYRWRDYEEVKDLVPALDELGLWALEAPFQPQQLEDYRRLADALETPIATGDQLTAMTEYLPLLDSGAVDVVQGGSARTGVSDMGRLADEAKQRGRSLVPWGWVPSTIAVAANLHRSIVHDNIPLIEYRPADLWDGPVIRPKLAGPEPEIRDGEFLLPDAPGYGVEVDWDLVEKLRLP